MNYSLFLSGDVIYIYIRIYDIYICQPLQNHYPHGGSSERSYGYLFSHREPGAKKIQIHQIEIYKYCGIIVGIEWLQGESGGMPPFPKNLIVDHRD